MRYILLFKYIKSCKVDMFIIIIIVIVLNDNIFLWSENNIYVNRQIIFYSFIFVWFIYSCIIWFLISFHNKYTLWCFPLYYNLFVLLNNNDNQMRTIFLFKIRKTNIYFYKVQIIDKCNIMVKKLTILNTKY